MNAVDVIVILFCVSMAALGFERGLVRSALPLAGFVAGVALGARIGPAVLNQGGSSPYAPAITVGSGLLLGLILAIAFDAAGMAIRTRLGAGVGALVVDGLGGAALLGALGLLLAWALGAAILHSSSPGARSVRSAIQDSRILAALNDFLPPTGPLLDILRRVDPAANVPGPEARVGRPDPAIASDPDVERAGASVVKVLGTACGLSVEGSGWVAAPGIVVTNAHVVAGETDTTVTLRDGGSGLDATAVHFDARNDLALLRVPGLGAAPLALASGEPKGTPGAVLGYPENGPFTVTPARLGQTGQVTSEDAYGRGPVERSMTAFRADVRSGNSGGPVVDSSGRVMTTVFAATQGSGPPSGLGVPDAVVASALQGRLRPTGTGPCTA